MGRIRPERREVSKLLMNREGDLVYLILGVSQLSEQLLDLFLGHLVSEVGQDVVKLGQHHGTVGVFVVQLEELEVVSVASLGVGGGDGGLDLLDDIVVLGELLALLVSLTLGDTGLKIVSHDDMLVTKILSKYLG